jgi:hypothetical protein
VIYVYGRNKLNWKTFEEQFLMQQQQQETKPSKTSVIVFYDVRHHYSIVEQGMTVFGRLSKLLDFQFVVTQIPIGLTETEDTTTTTNKTTTTTTTTTTNELSLESLAISIDIASVASTSNRNYSFCGRQWSLPSDLTMNDCSLLFIGPQSQTLTNILINFNQSNVSMLHKCVAFALF